MMAKSTIEVSDAGPGAYEVTVTEGSSASRHRVTMSDAALQRLTGGGFNGRQCLEAAFRFLLDREPKESILRSFDVAVISRYFPEFERLLPDYLGARQ
jgi:hypothetical protein